MASLRFVAVAIDPKGHSGARWNLNLFGTEQPDTFLRSDPPPSALSIGFFLAPRLRCQFVHIRGTSRSLCTAQALSHVLPSDDNCIAAGWDIRADQILNAREIAIAILEYLEEKSPLFNRRAKHFGESF
jgi:hypothetical protein